MQQASRRKFNLRQILTYTALLSLFLYYLLTWVNMLGDLYQRTGSDFIGFYSFGRIAQAKGYPSIYKIEEQQKIEDHDEQAQHDERAHGAAARGRATGGLSHGVGNQ